VPQLAWVEIRCFGGFRHRRITLRSLGSCAPKCFSAQGRRRVFQWRYHGLRPWGSIRRSSNRLKKEEDVATAFIFKEVLEDEEEHHDLFTTMLEEV
jgi:hypothetical protein